jgi:hypothetical protein
MDRTGQEPLRSANRSRRRLAHRSATRIRMAAVPPRPRSCRQRRLRRPLQAAPLAHSGPLLRAQLGPRRGPHPVRLGRARLPRLRLRHRHDVPGPPPSGRDAGDQGPGRQAAPHLQRPGLSRARRPAGNDARRRLPGPARHRLLRQLRHRSRRRRAQAGPPRYRTARHRRLPGRLPRPNLRRRLHHQLQHQLPAGLRAAPAVGLPDAVPERLPLLRRRRGSRDGRRDGRAPNAVGPRDPGLVGRGDHHRADPGRGRLQPRARSRSCASCARCATRTASC